MSNNYYYFEKEQCECCGRPFDPIHIGQSSHGWVFMLHIIPEKGINNLDDWLKLFDTEESVIKDEYDQKVSKELMIDIITKREPAKNSISKQLYRIPITKYFCVSKGGPTWDHVIGDFS